MQLEIAVIIQNQASSIRCEILLLRSNQLTASCNAINPFVDFLSEIKKKSELLCREFSVSPSLYLRLPLRESTFFFKFL